MAVWTIAETVQIFTLVITNGSFITDQVTEFLKLSSALVQIFTLTTQLFWRYKSGQSFCLKAVHISAMESFKKTRHSPNHN